MLRVLELLIEKKVGPITLPIRTYLSSVYSYPSMMFKLMCPFLFVVVHEFLNFFENIIQFLDNVFQKLMDFYVERTEL